MANRRLDIIIFGASGFTGMHCIKYIDKLNKEERKKLTWGIAGRSRPKLEQAIQDARQENQYDLAENTSLPIIIADVNEYESLVEMAKKARLLISCVGPFNLYGEPVVKACLEAQTHYIDVCGEPLFLEKIHLNYYDAALEKEIYMVGACGLDCIPVDLGVVFVQQKFEGTVNSVETYLKTWHEKRGTGPLINYGTWSSLINSITGTGELMRIRHRYYDKFKKPPTFEPKLQIGQSVHKGKDGKGWAVPFPGADRSVARRTQGYFYNEENLRPIQVATYFYLPSFFVSFIGFIMTMLVLFISRMPHGKELLLNYPAFFSFGCFSKSNPSKETCENTYFSVDLYGEGWKDTLANKDDQYTTPIDRKLHARITGQNPGYGATCLMLVAAGFTLLNEKDKMPNNGRGGIYTPGAAFAKTSLVKLLNKHGVTFEVVSRQDLNV